MDDKIRAIIDKLGFDPSPSKWNPVVCAMEDDRVGDPFEKLSTEELHYLIESGYLDK